MTQLQTGGIRLFRLFGIDVYLHWLWFLVAVVSIQFRQKDYSSLTWNALEYISLFGIVLMHEFGHALACRSVGGRADRIILWPLGGVAFVDPPQRPGAHLWSIAAGPLVNVALLPLTAIPAFMVLTDRWILSPDLGHYVVSLGAINLMLLVFNMLPIYPLDGGQILRSLLWFIIGPARSLQVASIIGMAGAAGFVALAVYRGSLWIGLIAAFGAFQSWTGFQIANRMQRIRELPRHNWAKCPDCGENPVAGDYWGCSCGQRFDIFASGFACPACGASADQVACPHCGKRVPTMIWAAASPPRPPLRQP